MKPGEKVQAVRLEELGDDADLPEDLDDSKVCYWQSPGGWWIYLPGGGIGRLWAHSVAWHDDGTITVAPSIAMRGTNDGGWKRHGFLERGIWREV